jgi:serine O-acetyltransferase
VNGNSKIGENCRIHVGVNIGTEAGYGDRAPTIGNNCYIAPGAKIFGKIVIGDNNVIGANAVVNKSFEQSGVSIAGVPAKIISYKGKNGLGKS